jgi:hypothetical protein
MGWDRLYSVPVTITVPDPGLLVPATLGLWHVAGGPPVQAWLATAVPITPAPCS